MNRSVFLFLVLLATVQTSWGQNSSTYEGYTDAVKEHVGTSSEGDRAYFGLRPPGLQPEVFAEHLVSKPERHEFGSVFSANGKEFFFGVDMEGKAEMWFSKLTNGVWTDPEVILSHQDYSFNDPMLSPNEEVLYFISDMPLSGVGEKKDYDIWYVKCQDGNWSMPINVGAPVNTSANEYYISFDNDGSMYFASNRVPDRKGSRNYDVFRSSLVNDRYQDPVKLENSINTKQYEADAFVAPDGSYLIFSSIREDGYGQGDLYISFRGKEGNWIPAKNMGSKINNEYHQLCPFVSKDGKYLFFTNNKDIYWVDAKIIDKYK